MNSTANAFASFTGPFAFGPSAPDKPGDTPIADTRYEVIATVGRRAISPPDLSELILDAARLCAEACDAEWFSVAETVPSGTSLRFRLGRRWADDRPPRVQEHELPTTATASFSAYAMQTNHPVVCTNLADETRFQDGLLREIGVLSGLTSPLGHQSRSFGVIGLYGLQPRSYTRADVLFVEAISHLLATTIARQQAEQALADTSRFSSAMFDTLEAPVVELTPDGRIVRFNRACQTITGFQVNEVRGRNVCSAFMIPEELKVLHEAFDRLRSGESPVRFETYVLTKHGDRRRLSWSFTTLREPAGSVVGILGTGIDNTAEYDALARLSKAESSAKRALQSLEELKQTIDQRELVFDQEGNFPEGVVRERRKITRRPFPYKQSLAPMRNGKLPAPNEFQEVRCHDLSSRGFSFLAPEAPNCREVIVAFGTPPSLIYVIGKIVHITAYRHESQDMFLVGCKYSGRAAY